MNFKWTGPYLLFGAIMLGLSGSSTAQNETAESSARANKLFDSVPLANRVSYTRVEPYYIDFERQVNDFYLDNKADSLRDAYVANMLRAQAKLNPLMGKRGSSAAVRQELPGAPVGRHCVWGQYTQLSRALNEMGDTLTLIPQGGRTSCSQFMFHMRNKYKNADYADCIHEGVMYETDSAYNVALQRYLTRHVKANAPDSMRIDATHKFAKTNFCADKLDAGSILIVPRYRGSRNTFHAIMYLGRGRIQDGKFIPDSTGRHIYTGHNRENIGDLFKTYDTSKIFAADIKKIVRNEYAKELQRIESMDTQELIAFLADENTPASVLQSYPSMTLLRMARDKYFKKETPDIKKILMPPVLAHSVDSYQHLRSLLPTQLSLKNQRSL